MKQAVQMNTRCFLVITFTLTLLTTPGARGLVGVSNLANPSHPDDPFLELHAVFPDQGWAASFLTGDMSWRLSQVAIEHGLTFAPPGLSCKPLLYKGTGPHPEVLFEPLPGGLTLVDELAAVGRLPSPTGSSSSALYGYVPSHAVTLEPHTRYWLAVLDVACFELVFTTLRNETGLPGWSIGDHGALVDSVNGLVGPGSDILKFQIDVIPEPFSLWLTIPVLLVGTAWCFLEQVIRGDLWRILTSGASLRVKSGAAGRPLAVRTRASAGE
jgi:hypothetical protein